MTTILFIEDDTFIREIYEVKLRMDLNATVTVASSGNMGIRLLEDRSDFDLVISDYSMEAGGGLDVLKFLENSSSSVPFFLYTSNVGLEIKTNYPFFKGIIHKFDYADLVTKASEVLCAKP